MGDQDQGIETKVTSPLGEAGVDELLAGDRDTDRYAAIHGVGVETNSTRRRVSASVCTRINALFNNCRTINGKKKLVAIVLIDGGIKEVNLVKPHHSMGDMVLFHEAVDCENSVKCEHWIEAPAWVPLLFNLYN